MIVFHLKNILDEINISQTKFARLANIRPNTINDICNNNVKRIEIENLDHILKIINQLNHKSIRIDDLIEYREE